MYGSDQQGQITAGSARLAGGQVRVAVASSNCEQAVLPNWGRVCIFLTRTSVVSVFHQPELSILADEMMGTFKDPGHKAYERGKGPVSVGGGGLAGHVGNWLRAAWL